jgi:hypothetical protein
MDYLAMKFRKHYVAAVTLSTILVTFGVGCVAVNAVKGLPAGKAPSASGAGGDSAQKIAHADNAGLSERSASEAYNLEHGRYRDGCDPDKTLPPTEEVARHCAHTVEQEARVVEYFTPSERALPRVQKILASVANLKAYSEKVDAEVHGQQASAHDSEKLWMEYLAMSRGSRDGIKAVLAFKNHTAAAGTVLPGALAAKARSLKGFAEACTTRFRFVKVPATHHHDVQTYGEFIPPEEQCRLATEAEATVTRELKAAYAQVRTATNDLEIKESAKVRGRLKSGFGVSASWMKCARDPRECLTFERDLLADAASVGMTVEAPPPPAPSIEGEFQEAVKAAQAAFRLPTFHDAAAEAAMRQSLASAKVTVLALALKSLNPVILKNGVDIPVSKRHVGRFVTKVAGENYCRAYETGAVSQYTGGGTFGRYDGGTVSLDGDFLVVSCN